MDVTWGFILTQAQTEEWNSRLAADYYNFPIDFLEVAWKSLGRIKHAKGT